MAGPNSHKHETAEITGLSTFLSTEASRRSQRRLTPDVISFSPEWTTPAGVANVGTANNLLSYACRSPKTGELRDLMIFVAVSSGNIGLSAYSVGAGSATRNRLYTSGSIACPATGWQIPVDPKIAVEEGGLIGLSLSCDNLTAQFGRYTNHHSASAAELPAAYNPEGAIRSSVVKAGAFPDAGAAWATPGPTTLNFIIVGRIV